MQKTYVPIVSSPLNISEDKDNRNDLAITRTRTDGEEPLRLYLVTHIRTRKYKYPSTIICYVLAESEEGAIGQSEMLAFPESTDAILYDENKQFITSSAHRIPFLMRGWGSRTL